MNERSDEQLDQLLREHFAAELDGQLGRSARRFADDVSDNGKPHLRLVGSSADAPERPRWRPLFWSLGLTGAAVAAGIALVMVLNPLLSRNPQRPILVADNGIQPPLGVDESTTGAATPDATLTGVDEAAPRDLEHALSWNTIDQGTVYLDGDVPLRSVLRQANETVSWYDPKRQARVEMTVPRDEVMLVGYQSQ